MHRIEAHAEVASLQQPRDGREVEQAREQVGVVGDRIDHLDHGRAEARRADGREIDVAA